ncbi:MAG: hypothetical protein Q8L47_04185 [bacterium]|nr:hypothetical protein [bacterium]
MIITLYGPDAYRRNKKLDQLILSYTEKRANLALEVVDAEDEDGLERARSFLVSSSLFQDTKLVVIKNAISGTDQGQFKKLFKNIVITEESTLIISDDTKLITKDLSFLKDKPNRVQEFANLNNREFVTFIGEEAKARNINIPNDVVEYLARAFLNNSWGVTQELDKLSLLKSSEITKKLIKNSGVNIEGDFFAYISYWFRKPVSERLLNLESLFASKNDAAKIFNILAYQDQSQLRRFADYDVEIKSGKLEYEEALLELALI